MRKKDSGVINQIWQKYSTIIVYTVRGQPMLTATMKGFRPKAYFGNGWFFDCTIVAILGFLLGWNSGWIIDNFF